MNTKRLKQLFDTSTNKHADAKKIGVSYNSILKILDGGDFKVSTLEMIARYYNVPVGYFFDEAEADGRSAQQLEIEYLKGQIKGLQDALDRLGYDMKGLILNDN